MWFYLTWRDPRVRGQIAAAEEKMATDETFKCESPCQSNNKAAAGGCCDGECVRLGGVLFVLAA